MDSVAILLCEKGQLLDVLLPCAVEELKQPQHTPGPRTWPCGEEVEEQVLSTRVVQQTPPTGVQLVAE